MRKMRIPQIFTLIRIVPYLSRGFKSKLGNLWNNGSFEGRQSLQKLMFPTGVLFDKEVDDYRTDNENEVFKILDQRKNLRDSHLTHKFSTA